MSKLGEDTSEVDRVIREVGYSGEHPAHGKQAWRDSKSRLGYWAWVQDQINKQRKS